MTEIVAHAGRPSPDYRANSAEAFAALAQRPEIDRVEFDLWVTDQGDLLLAHDRESIDDQTLTLEQGLELLAGLDLPLHCDLKTWGQEDEIVAAHYRAGVLGRTLFCGHDLEVLTAIGAASPTPLLGWSVPQFNCPEIVIDPDPAQRPAEYIELIVSTCQDYGLDGIMAHWSLVDDQLASTLRGANLFLHVWTVDETPLARSLAPYSPTGLTSNDPSRIAAAIA